MTIFYKTVKVYAEMWKRHEKTIYLKIAHKKIIACKEPGGNGILIPVCDCKNNHFPEKTLCTSCAVQFNTT